MRQEGYKVNTQDSACLHSEEAGGGRGRSEGSREEEEGEGGAIMG